MKKQKQKKCICLILSTILLFSFPITAQAKGTSNYNYNSEYKEYDYAPAAYETERVLFAKDFGVDSLNDMTAVFVTDDRVYLAASDKIVITDWNFQTEYILSEYTDTEGNQQTINAPAGLFVTEEGELYVTEPNKGRILKFNSDYQLMQTFGKPAGFDLDITYSPTQIVVDKVGRMYVIAKNVYEGILELNYDGEFSRYFGVNNVSFSVLDLFWRSIATEAQRAKMELWLPTEFTNLAIAEDGFIYTTCQSEEQIEPIKLLNAKGKNVLVSQSEIEYPAGDINYMLGGANGVGGPSTLAAVDCNDYGMYTVLDSKRNRIFTYDKSGHLLFVFGGSADQKGSFRNPVSIRFMGDNILVVDQLSQALIVMKPTEYAKLIIKATKLHYEGLRDDAIPVWKEVIKINPNLQIAYDGIGKSAFSDGDFETAMQMFRLANNKVYYSKAFDKVRNEFVKQNFSVFMTAIILLIAANYGWKFYKRRKFGRIIERSEE